MPSAIGDRDEAAIVQQQLLTRTNLDELLGQLCPAETSLDELMLTTADEEVNVELVNDEGQAVGTLFVDVLGDPVNEWTMRLRGWKLKDDVAGV